MAIPPFSEQDLAELVLGYLHDEELMTVYDEFLVASPYLDAQKNEYRRIWMRSLQSIVAEHWAIKIYLEKCKPYTLRRKLKQCSNMLEVVKFLVFNVDMKKIQLFHSTSNKPGERSRILSVPPRDNRNRECEECGSSQVENCLCNKRTAEDQSNGEPLNLQSIGTTSLADLPGNSNIPTRRKMKVLDKDSAEAASLAASCERTEEANVGHCVGLHMDSDQVPLNQPCDAQYDNNLPTTSNIPNIQQSARDFNEDAVSNSQEPERDSTSDTGPNRRMSLGFEAFSSGVEAGTQISITKPDSSTSEPAPNLPSASQPEGSAKTFPTIIHPTLYPCSNMQVPGKYLFQVTNTKNLAITPNTENSSNSSDENKITILSDVKVDNSSGSSGTVKQTKTLRRLKAPPLSVLQNAVKTPMLNNTTKTPMLNTKTPMLNNTTKTPMLNTKTPMLNNATKTPILQMQTIVINGTPAYKPEQQSVFTEEEIMAMPTLIIVTAAGPTKSVADSVIPSIPKTNVAVTSTLKTATPTTVAASMEPLSIDVSNPTNSTANQSFHMPSLGIPTNETGLVTTVDSKNASVPKDSTISIIGKTSTPQIFPPARKSSSTPRRTSHVRVLDFTTPRRILHETINENPGEIIVSRSPNLHLPENSAPVDNKEMVTNNDITDNAPAQIVDDSSTKENKTNVRRNWDDDLRALIAASTQAGPSTKSTPNPRTKPKKVICSFEQPIDSNKSSKTKKKVSSNKVTSSKKKKTKAQKNVDEPIVVDDDEVIPVKPTIHIVTDWKNSAQEADKTENKSGGETTADTPEMDRISLQNVMGVKLNISDLLETPYKQALLDIQMETPKFLRSDIPIPDEPVSEIKISDIPTPRFFEMAGLGFTPKPVDATPSTYSSRPTDYSSGGSYYKPDDQDYVPDPDDLGCPITSTESTKSGQPKEKDKDENKTHVSRSTRPVRQCTKNVSYCGNKSKIEDKSNDTQISAHDTTVTSDEENKKEISTSSKLETKTKPKTEPKRRSTGGKKHKSPVKKATPRSFMKIKPRRPTPTKESKRKSASSHSSHSKIQSRKRTTSKENPSASTPPITPAPTKSRRKSSTPRKIPSDVYQSSESPDIIPNGSSNRTKESVKLISPVVPDSDNENIPLRWSDDCSQDAKPKLDTNSSVNEAEDITQIQAYIEQTSIQKDVPITGKISLRNESGSLHMDLIKRGFDIETAKSIERDLLDTPPLSTVLVNVLGTAQETEQKSTNIQTVLDKSADSEKLNIIQEDKEEDDDELSVYEGNNDYDVVYDDTVDRPKTEPHKLKDNYTMEFTYDDDTFTLTATPITILFAEEPKSPDETEIREVEAAVISISNFDRLYSPMKEAIQDTCRQIFDSTLASLDTPMKAESPERYASITEIVLEVESIRDDVKEKVSKKRKRMQSGSGSDESTSDSKRNRREPRLLPNIQNIDIESVLSKLHGP